MNSKGFSLIELLVAISIIGILAAIATPFYLSATKKARYADAIVTMDAIASEVSIAKNEASAYPRDVGRGIIPASVSFFPTDPGEIPFGSKFDYDSYEREVNGESFCWVQIVFLGENGDREASIDVYEGALGAIATVGDDRILVVAAGECGEI